MNNELNVYNNGGDTPMAASTITAMAMTRQAQECSGSIMLLKTWFFPLRSVPSLKTAPEFFTFLNTVSFAEVNIIRLRNHLLNF